MTELHLWFARNMAKAFEVEGGSEPYPVQGLYHEHQAWTAMLPAQFSGLWRVH